MTTPEQIDVRVQRYDARHVVRVVADVHVGNHRKLASDLSPGINTRANAVLGALACAVTPRPDGGAPERLIVAGDLFDTPRPVPQLIGAVGDVLRDADGADWSRILLAGNHDASSGAHGDTALSALSAVPGVAVLDLPTILLVGPHFGRDGYVFAWWLLPFAPRQTADTVREVITACASRTEQAARQNGWEPDALCPIVVSHFGIEGPSTPAFLRGHGIACEELDALCAQYHIQGWLSGDWHERALFEAPQSDATIMQIGALAPTGFDNPAAPGDPYGTVVRVLCDPQAGIVVSRNTAPGPRFHVVKVPGAAEARALLRALRDKAAAGDTFRVLTVPDVTGCPAYVSARPADAATAAVLLAEAGDLLGTVLEVVAPDNPAARTERRALARAVRTAENIDKAVAVYTGQHVDGDDQFRADVTARVRSLLAAAGGAV